LEWIDPRWFCERSISHFLVEQPAIATPRLTVSEDREQAGRYVEAYERLKLEMDRLKKHR
jgi:hypothetical protein